MENSKYEAETHTSNNHSLHESRFKVLQLFYRLGGIPVKVKSASRLNAAFNAILIFSFYFTVFGFSVDVFVHRHNLTLVMKKLRMVLLTYADSWIHYSVR
jgi:hypothetical protein